MPKDRGVQSLSQSRMSPYPCSSSSREAKQYNTEILAGPLEEDAREWEETRCPICLDHPHNAVLLHCSSFDKGCRPYMCDTSYRHSNCLDQFFKTSESNRSTEMLQEIPSTAMDSSIVREEVSLPGQPRHDVRLLKQNLICPLCRGEIYGYVVVEAARQFMNYKVRSCSCEDCDFSGTYSELRKHARLEHPATRPTEVDPIRQHAWRRSENIRGLRDLISAVQTAISEVNGGENISPYSSYDTFVRSLLQIYLFYEVNGLSVREEVHDNMSPERPLRFRYSSDLNPASRYRSSNDLRLGRTHGSRYNSEHHPRWSNNLQAGRWRYNVESSHAPRQNDILQPQRSNNSRGLRWRGQQRPRFNDRW